MFEGNIGGGHAVRHSFFGLPHEDFILVVESLKSGMEITVHVNLSLACVLAKASI